MLDAEQADLSRFAQQKGSGSPLRNIAPFKNVAQPEAKKTQLTRTLSDKDTIPAVRPPFMGDKGKNKMAVKDSQLGANYVPRGELSISEKHIRGQLKEGCGDSQKQWYKLRV